MSEEGLKSIVVEILVPDDDLFAQNFTKEANLNTDAATMLFRAVGIDGMYAVRFAVRPDENRIIYYAPPGYEDKLRELDRELEQIPEVIVRSINL